MCAKNYQLWWRFEDVLTKTIWVIFDTPCTLDRFRLDLSHATSVLFVSVFIDVGLMNVL